MCEILQLKNGLLIQIFLSYKEYTHIFIYTNKYTQLKHYQPQKDV